MAFKSDFAERSLRAGVSLRHCVQDELDAHPGWWIPTLAACLIWAVLPKRGPQTYR